MKKKLLSAFLTVSMIAAMTGCGSDENASAPTGSASQTGSAALAGSTAAGTSAAGDEEAYQLDSITLVVDGTFNASLDAGQEEFIEQWEDAVGIDLVINQLDHASYIDSVGRLFASGDYPDVILLRADMYAEYVKTGLLWDMTEAYNNSDFKTRVTMPEVEENVQIGGKQYGIAVQLGGGCVSYVKKAWLDAVNIDPSTVTDWDSYYAMLTAFAKEDPDGNGKNDTYGVAAAGFISSEAPYTNYLPEFWQNAYPYFKCDENGVWYDGFDTEETKAALLRLQQAYADGVIDPETLTASTKDVREKFWSSSQDGSFGVFTYWAGYWNDNIVENLSKNGVDTELVRLAPIAEMDGYLNRQSFVYCIIDDGDGNDDREQAIFDAFFETMFDGGTVQTLWVYGAEGLHWSTEAETVVVGEGEKATSTEYAAGEFHTRIHPATNAELWKKNAMDPSSMVVPLTNGFETATDLTKECNTFFAANCVDAPSTPSCDALTENGGTISDVKGKVISEVVVNGGDVEEWMTYYEEQTADMVAQVLDELNQQ